MIARTFNKYGVIFLLCLIWRPSALYAVNALQIAQRTIVKKIAIGKNDRLRIKNQYGDVIVRQWSSPFAMIKISINCLSPKLSRANTLIRLIHIKSHYSPGQKTFETVIDTISVHMNYSSEDECHITYHVFAPRGIKLMINNRLGNTHIKSFSGRLNVDQKFGDVKIEHLSGPLSCVAVQGNIDIDYINKGTLEFKAFNSIRIGKLSGNINAKFSSGGRIDLKVADDLRKLNIEVNNTNAISITNLRAANADVKIQSTLSKVIYNEHMLYKAPAIKNYPAIDSLAIAMQKDSSKKKQDRLIELKKLTAEGVRTKSQDYHFKTGVGANRILINASFSLIQLTD